MEASQPLLPLCHLLRTTPSCHDHSPRLNYEFDRELAQHSRPVKNGCSVQLTQKHSERYLQDPNQLSLDFGNTPEAADAAAGLAEAVDQAGIEVKGHTRHKKDRDKPPERTTASAPAAV